MMFYCLCLAAILQAGVPILASSVSPPNGTATGGEKAYLTLEGVFNYYWKSDPSAEHVKFLFVCGQIGGVGKLHEESSCTCDHPKSCVNCYRWFDAVTLESIASYGIYMNTKNHSDVAETLFDHSPYNANWNATAYCTFIDDFSWYGLAYLRVYEWLKDPKWLNRSLEIYEWAWQYGWDGDCGGFWWSNCDISSFKDSITIVEVLHFAAKLSYMFPNQSRYLNDTKKIWNWFFHFDNGYGLMSDKYLVSTGAIPEKCCNASSESSAKCHNTGLSGTSYNQGLLMSASGYLYLATGNATYLKIGLRLLDAILKNYTTKEGVLVDEPRSYQSYEGSCWGGADPGGDWYSFNGIFMRHLGYFIDLLSHAKILDSNVFTEVKNMVDKTSELAWNRSAVWPPFDYTDGCNIGVEPLNGKLKLPKFHWWWAKAETLQTIPPDPKFFFHRRKLGCTATNGSSPLWKGVVKHEYACMKACASRVNCSKYQFRLPPAQNSLLLAKKKKLNCWLWSYNRSNHQCKDNNKNFNIGIKRPVGNATCSSICGSKDPQSVENGICHCDDMCAWHMDCCLDYADHCLPDEPILCKGNCTDLTARPIPQGGYCWCFDGCNGWFTDNNSDGSCCSDYPQECMKIPMPVCLDGRSQTSALDLFITQYKLSTIKP